jgi:lysophospholipase L1-like esterase
LIVVLAFILVSCQARSINGPGTGHEIPIATTTYPKKTATIQAAQLSSPTPVPGRTEVVTFTPEILVTRPSGTSTVECPRTILFYGDSRLGALGVSFIDEAQKRLGACYKLINAAFWAHTAQWGAENLEARVISRNADDVALWWGANDFNGCNGTYDPNTDLPDANKFQSRLTAYISAMKSQIETLARLGKPVYIFDEPRVNGGRLPWAIVDEKGTISGYDHNHLCAWDWVSDAVAAAQKQLVMDETVRGFKVILVDVWQLYLDEGTLPDMYSTDVVHPGKTGRDKIAELFMEVYSPNP